jgi:hypothetical protein
MSVFNYLLVLALFHQFLQFNLICTFVSLLKSIFHPPLQLQNLVYFIRLHPLIESQRQRNIFIPIPGQLPQELQLSIAGGIDSILLRHWALTVLDLS